jgi:hypothetical protein
MWSTELAWPWKDTSEVEAVTPDFFATLELRTQDNLVGFLRAEMELAFTFCGMARSTEDLDHRARLLVNAQKALDAIRHFEERIADPSIREELLRQATMLEKRLAKV